MTDHVSACGSATADGAAQGTDSLALTTARVMERMGFPATETGPYVTALRRRVACQVANGLVGRSAGWWSPEGARLSCEARAQHTLAFDWEADRYSYRVECIDGAPWGWRFNCRTMRYYFRVQWGRIPAYAADHLRRWRTLSRKWWEKRVCGVRNPYLPLPSSEARS